LKLIFSMF